MRTSVVVALALAFTLVTPTASAQGDVEAEAQALYEKGEAAYAAGRFEDALAAFDAAYAKAPVPALLFNIGQCHRKLAQHDEAAAAYQRYLDEETEAIPNRPEVEELIAEEKKLAAEARVLTTPSPAPEPSGPPLYEEPLFWAAGGVALAAVVGGAVIAVVATQPPPAGTLGTFDLRAP